MRSFDYSMDIYSAKDNLRRNNNINLYIIMNFDSKDIKGLAFDFWGVIAKKQFPLDEYLRKINVSPEKYNAKIYKLVIKADLGQITSQEFVKGCSEIIGIDLPYEKCRAIYREDLMNKSLVRLVRAIKGKYKIAILTNNIKDHVDTLIHKSPLDDLFDHVVTSYDVGYRKPAPEIYEALIEKMKLKPEEILFLDDDQRNLPEAQKQGIKSLLYKWGETDKILTDHF